MSNAEFPPKKKEKHPHVAAALHTFIVDTDNISL